MAINPILQGPPNPIEGLIPQLAQVPQTPTGGGGVFADLFGAGQGQSLPPDQRRQLGQSALGAAGQSLLESSGPGPGGFTPGTLQAIGRALGAGQEQFAVNAAEREAQQAEKAARDEREILLANATDPASRRVAYNNIMERALVSGNETEVKNAKAALDSLGEDVDKFVYETVDDVLYQFDSDGKLVNKFADGKEEEVLGVLTDRQFDRMKDPLRDFNASTRGVREVPTQFLRVVGSATPLAELDQEEWANATEEQKKQLSFAAVSALSSYARLIDPNSVVRTSEMELLLGQGSWKEKLETMIARAIEGTMSPTLARALIAEAKAQTKAQKQAYQGFVDEYFVQARGFADLDEAAARQLITNPYDRIDIDNPDVPDRIDPSVSRLDDKLK